jgi:hypothetical protein
VPPKKESSSSESKNKGLVAFKASQQNPWVTKRQ